VSRSAAEDADVAAQLAAMREDGLPVEPYEGPRGPPGLLFPDDAAFQPLDPRPRAGPPRAGRRRTAARRDAGVDV
jgi:hypothetical protein